MGTRRLGQILGVSGVAAMMLLAAPPAVAEDRNQDRGATIEEFVCFKSTGDKTRIGTGKVITTPSGNSQLVCTGKPL